MDVKSSSTLKAVRLQPAFFIIRLCQGCYRFSVRLHSSPMAAMMP